MLRQVFFHSLSHTYQVGNQYNSLIMCTASMGYLEEPTAVSYFDPPTARQVKLLQIRASINNWEQSAAYNCVLGHTAGTR